MKFFKAFLIILGLVFVLESALFGAAFVVAKHIKIKDLVEEELEQELGIKVSIRKLTFSPLLTHVFAEGISVLNPAGFNEKEMGYINSLHLVWDLGDIVFLKKPTVYLMALDLDHVHIIKNKSGQVNLKELLPIQPGPRPPDQTPFSFDAFILSIGQVTYTDHTLPAVKTHVYTINIKDEAFFKVMDEDKLIRLVIYNALKNTDIGKFIDLNVSVLSGVSDTLESALDTAKTTAKGMFQIVAFPFKVLFSK